MTQGVVGCRDRAAEELLAHVRGALRRPLAVSALRGRRCARCHRTSPQHGWAAPTPATRHAGRMRSRETGGGHTITSHAGAAGWVCGEGEGRPQHHGAHDRLCGCELTLARQAVGRDGTIVRRGAGGLRGRPCPRCEHPRRRHGKHTGWPLPAHSVRSTAGGRNHMRHPHDRAAGRPRQRCDPGAPWHAHRRQCPAAVARPHVRAHNVCAPHIHQLEFAPAHDY